MAIDFSNKTFLVVDDFEKFRNVLKGIIQLSGGKQIDLASSGADAISRIKAGHYDVILCDYHLGAGKNGQQVLEQLRYENLLPISSIFLMVTAESGAEMVMGAIECQPDGYLMKPFNQAMLKSRLNKILATKEALAPIYEAIETDRKVEGIEMCQRLSTANPKYLTCMKRMEAELLIEMGDYVSAQEIYETILNIKPLPWAALGLGQVHYLLEQYEDSVETLESLIKDNKLVLQAYDWLAKSKLALGLEEEAEDILKQAIQLSPKAILRQIELGGIALKNGDLEVAENSFRAAVKLGRNSVHKSPDCYINFAKAIQPKLISENEVTKKLATDETFGLLNEVKNDYKNDKAVAVEASLMEAQSYSQLRNDKEAAAALECADKLLKTMSGKVPAQVKADMVATLSKLGKQAEAEQAARELILECKDSPDILAQLGCYIESSPLNAEGMALYRKGKYREAMREFTKACEEYPTSLSLNLNVIQAILKVMEQAGSTPELISRCDAHWDCVRNIPQGDKRYKRSIELRKLYNSLV